jgi:hypothetical protein
MEIMRIELILERDEMIGVGESLERERTTGA